MTSVKTLLEAKQYYEAHIEYVNAKIEQMRLKGKTPEQQKKQLQRKLELEISLQTIMRQIEMATTTTTTTAAAERQIIYKKDRGATSSSSSSNNIPGEGKRQAGKALIGLGIFITIISFLAGGGLGGAALGFIINIIGIGLYVSGNKEQGRETTVFGGGFVASTGG